MLSFCQWLQSTAFFTEFRGSGIVYPVILSLHVLMIAMFGVMILITDLRLLGGLRKYSVAELLDKLRMPKRVGFTLIVLCGLMLFGAKAEEYYYNVFFRSKMIILSLILIHAALFRAGVYRNGAARQLHSAKEKDSNNKGGYAQLEIIPVNQFINKITHSHE